MSNYINEIKTKDGQKYDVQDKRLEKVPVSEVENGVLKVTEIKSSGPTPVATIDGVDYYHKHEFDLEALVEQVDAHKAILLLTGEVLSDVQPNPYQSFLTKNSNDDLHLELYYENGPGNITLWMSSYTSRVFTVVHSKYAVTDYTKICLPENVTAYYGFLSEDGKTFISYWNEGESAPTEITEVTDGENTLPIHDKRIIEVSAEDVGKVLTVEEDGSLDFKAPAGTKLYKHTLTLNGVKKDGMQIYVILVSLTATTISDINSLGSILLGGYELECYCATPNGQRYPLIVFEQDIYEQTVYRLAFTGSFSLKRYDATVFSIDNGSIILTNTPIDETISSISDTVTEL